MATASPQAFVGMSFCYVEVQDGVVQLSGTVGSAAEKRHALTRAWVAGVQEVEDSALEVSWWTNNTRQRDRHYAIVEGFQIEVEVKDGIARLGEMAGFFMVHAPRRMAMRSGGRRCW